MPEEAWVQGLSSLPVHLQYFETIGSSNDAALQWIEDGAREYSLIVADQQTAGRGRLQRKWFTTAGAALAFSLILHPSAEEREQLTLFSPLVAMALCDALSRYPGLKFPGCCQIKWPNDVLIHGRKAAGVLLESSWIGTKLKGVVIGMGVNVRPEAVPAGIDLLFPATSVEEQANQHVDRIELLRNIIEHLIEFREILLTDAFIKKYNELLAFKGKEVKIQQQEHTHTGTILGVQPNGNLLLKNNEGQQISVSVGDVHLRPI
jgi:BirA family biotin operon repressor/biotin-[acetyl-CoA-carboxylase] ligase